MKKLKLVVVLIFIFFLGGCNLKEKMNNKSKCLNKNIRLKYLSDLDNLIYNGYICDSSFNHFSNDRLKKCKVVFSDSNYKIATNFDKTRIIFDKKNDLILALNYTYPDFKIRDDYSTGLYILNEKLMPIYSVTHSWKEGMRVFNYKYKNGKCFVYKAIDEESKDINIDKLLYSDVVILINDIRNRFVYIDTGLELDSYFYKTPYWTEGIN